MQFVFFPHEGEPVVLAGDPDCNQDPCEKHGRCHCMCVCGCYDPGDEGYDDCADCKENFGDDDDETGEWKEIGLTEG
jgi:hypothetical protein